MKAESDTSVLARGQGGANFRTTRWSVVVAAGDSKSPASKAALEQLCRDYWQPLFVFARRSGNSREEAEDATQGLFSKLIERGDFKRPTPERGRFRSFLLSSFKNFLITEWRRGEAEKRGSKLEFISRDAALAEGHHLADPADAGLTPDKIFEHRWAMSVLDRAVAQFEVGFKAPPPLAKIRHLILGGAGETEKVIADQLGMPLNTLKSHVRRGRADFRKVFRQIVAATVQDPTEVEDEMRALRAALLAPNSTPSSL